MEEKTNAFMETESVGRLMRKFSVPCIISLLVAALYNIVDQIFIANASYLGSYGNAANTVVFPLTIVALAIAVMIGDGACAYVSISLNGRQCHCTLHHCQHHSHSPLSDSAGTVTDIVWRQSQRRHIQECQRILLLDHAWHPVLHVRSGR